MNEPGPIMPVYGAQYPDELLDAMVTAALKEMKWRISDYYGLPISPHVELELAMVPRFVMPRYRDILGLYWVACYVHPISYALVISLLTNENYLEAIEAAKALDHDDPERWYRLHGLQQHRQVQLL